MIAPGAVQPIRLHSDLSKAEQIRYLQALWDRIAERPGDILVPESQLALAEERLVNTAEIQAGHNRPTLW
jgi:hypothetical protein